MSFARGLSLRIRGEEQAPVTKALTLPDERERHTVQILKSDEPEERFVLGIVLEPLKDMKRKDSQKDQYSAEAVRKASDWWMLQGHHSKHQHEGDFIDERVRVIRNWITHEDTIIGGRAIAKGTWLLGVKVLDDQLWADTKAGKITGFSIGGWAKRALVQ